MPTSIVPRIYDPGFADCNLGISTEEAYGMMKRMAREEGLLVGISSAAAMVGCLRIAGGVGPEAVIVTVFPDAADKYLSERFWDEF